MRTHTALHALISTASVLLCATAAILSPYTAAAQDTHIGSRVDIYCPAGLMETMYTDESGTLTEPEAPEYNGYEHAGWSATPIIDATDFTPLSFPLTVTADTRLYAVYKQSQDNAAYYTEVTSPDDITDGLYIITAEKDGVIYTMEDTINARQKPIPTIIISHRPDDPASSLPDSIMIWHIEPAYGGYFYIKHLYNGIEYHTAANNKGIYSSTSGSINWEIKQNTSTQALSIKTGSTIIQPDGSNGWKGYSQYYLSYAIRLYLRHETEVTATYSTVFRTSEEQNSMPAPQNLLHDNSQGQISLSWDTSAENAEYIVTVGSDNSTQSYNTASSTYTIDSMQPCTAYRISVRAIDPTNGTLPSEPATAEITLSPIVTLDPNGGVLPDGIDSTTTLICGSETGMTLPKPEAPDGMTFVGWDDLSTDIEDHIAAGETLAPDRSASFMAIWRETLFYSLTYVIDKKEHVLKYKETEYVLPIDTPTISGYNFFGWSTATDYVHGQTPLFSFGSPLSSDTVIYAVFTPDTENVAPVSHTKELSSGVYILVQESEGKFYALGTSAISDALTTKVTDITSNITAAGDSLILDVAGLTGKASLFRIDVMEGEKVRIKDVATNLYISGYSSIDGINSKHITSWQTNPTEAGDGSIYINSTSSTSRWKANTRELSWVISSSTATKYTSGKTYLFKTGYNTPIDNSITFVSDIVAYTDTLPSPALSVTPYVGELFIEWQRTDQASSYILSIPEINFSETLSPNVHSYSISGLEQAHRYRVELQAISDNSETLSSNTVTAYATTLSETKNDMTVKKINA